METYNPGGKYVNSSDGEGIISLDKDNAFREWKLKKYEKVFNGRVEQLEDGRVVYTGSWAGADYGLTVAVFCK